MSDLTPLFLKCTTIYEEDLKAKGKISNGEIDLKSKGNNNDQAINDKLISEAKQLNKAIVQISNFLESIKVAYLLSSERSTKSHHHHNKNKNKNKNKTKGTDNIENLDEDSKDQIDSSIQIQLQKLSKQLKHMELYETKRLELDQKQEETISLSKITMNFISMGNSETVENINKLTIHLFRANVLKYLSINLQNVSKKFLDMKEKRLDRKRELNKSSLNTNSNYQFMKSNPDLTESNESSIQGTILATSPPPQSQSQLQSQSQIEGSISTEFEEDIRNQLSEQQLQELVKENEELKLQFKNEELVKVNKMESSIFEISQLVNDIGYELNQQNSVINKLIDNNYDILNNVSQGNLQLVKSNERSKNSTNRIISMILILSFLLLLIDWIL